MISLKDVSKSFNRRRANEIKAINNTSVELGDTGLVTFLGNSGCGKTTLLNAIGGLDKVDKGTIYIDGEKITGRFSGKVDSIRNMKIGYIFQNYNLIEDATVFDNVAIALKMIGFKDKKAIERRVLYVLDRVGIARYKNRPAKMLSGGERQRIGIARAIVKNPSIIIADEPTGNLDSANTIEIMNIIKALSKEKLVILVTHERNIAEFYADRILEIVDGSVVNDRLNEHGGKLDYSIETTIHLKDMPYQKTFNEGGFDLRLYSDIEEVPPRINVVVRDGNIYIDTGGKLKQGSEWIEIRDDHYEGLTRDIYEEYRFDYDTYFRDAELIEKETDKKAAGKGFPKRLKYSPIYTIFNSLIKGFKSVHRYSKLKKILLIGFFVASMFVIYSFSNYAGVSKISDEKFMKADKSYVTVDAGKMSPGLFEDINKKLEGEHDVSYVIPGDSQVHFNMPLTDYMQSSTSMQAVDGSLTRSDLLGPKDVIYGRSPETAYELVLDKVIMKNLLGNPSQVREVGLVNAKDLIGHKLYLNSYMPAFTVVGIADRKSPCIYVSAEGLRAIIVNGYASKADENGNEGGGIMINQPLITDHVYDWNLFAGNSDIEIVKGTAPEEDYQVLAPEYLREEVGIGQKINIKVNGNNLVISGYYHDKWGGEGLFVNENTAYMDALSQYEGVAVSTGNKAIIKEIFEDPGTYKTHDLYMEDRKAYEQDKQDEIKRTLIAALVMIAISLIEMYLILRASFLSRIKEVGVLRAIGLKKSDIYKMFSGEVAAITLITSLPGMLIMSYFLNKAASSVYLGDQFVMNPMIVIGAFLLVFVCNLIFGLLPVFNTLRKTPAAILARNDVN